MKTEKHGNNWTAYCDPDTNRYFAEIMYTRGVSSTITRSHKIYTAASAHFRTM